MRRAPPAVCRRGNILNITSLLFLVCPNCVVIFVVQHQKTTLFPEIGVVHQSPDYPKERVTCASGREAFLPLIASAPMSRSETLVRSHVETRCSILGPTQSRISPSMIQYTKILWRLGLWHVRGKEGSSTCSWEGSIHVLMASAPYRVKMLYYS